MTDMPHPDAAARGGLTLAHLSDPHLPLPPGVPLSRIFNKRLLSLLSWHVKRHRRHRRAVLDPLVADLQSHAPDQIAVTGDLTNLGLEAEYRQARDWLAALGAPERVMVIPGNHEALVPGAWEAGAALWQPWWQGDAPGAEAFPYLRRRGPLALIGMSSAIASPPGLAVGATGAAQIARLGAMLARTREEGRARVVMIHHPPLEGTVIRRKRLRDGRALCAVLAREGVELVLHGHSHRSHFQQIETASGPAPVIGVPSASSMHHEPAAYNLCRIAPAPGGWALTVTPRRLSAAQGVEAGEERRLTLLRAHAHPGV